MGSKTYHRYVWRKLGYDRVRLTPSEFLTINKSISLGFQKKLTADACVRSIIEELEGKAA
jgi:hypothetical protein